MAQGTKVGDAFIELGVDSSKVGAGFEKAASQGMGFGAVLKGVLGANLIQTGINALIQGGKAVAEEFMQDEVAVTKFGATLKSFGGDVASVVPAMEAFAASMQEQIGVGDDVVMNLATQATQYGVSADKLEDITKASIGLGQAMGVDASSAMHTLTKAMEGNFMMLERQFPQLRNMTSEEEKFAFVLERARAGMDAQSAAANTLSGHLVRMKAALKELDIKAFFAAFRDVDQTAADALKGFDLKQQGINLEKYKNDLKGLVDQAKAEHDLQQSIADQKKVIADVDREIMELEMRKQRAVTAFSAKDLQMQAMSAEFERASATEDIDKSRTKLTEKRAEESRKLRGLELGPETAALEALGIAPDIAKFAREDIGAVGTANKSQLAVKLLDVLEKIEKNTKESTIAGE